MEALKEVRMIQNLSSSALLSNMIAQLNNLSVRSAFQDKSYVEVGTMVKNKEFILLVLNIIIDASSVINPYKKGDERIFSKCIIISLEE